MSGTFRLLVVDDDDDLRETLCDVLRSEGYDVSSAGGGRQAFEWLHASPPPDLILLDLVMPDIGGKALFSLLQQDPTLRGIRILGLTGLDMRASEEALPCRTISKPIGLTDLLSCIAEMLAPASPAPPEPG